jgi:hypothetical protein
MRGKSMGWSVFGGTRVKKKGGMLSFVGIAKVDKYRRMLRKRNMVGAETGINAAVAAPMSSQHCEIKLVKSWDRVKGFSIL